MEIGLLRAAARTWRVAAVLMVIALTGCDNVEWGGVEVAVVPPPPKSGPAETQLGEVEELPQGAILYLVTRDSTRTTAVPVAEIADGETRPIRMGDDPKTYGDRFISSFLRAGGELTLFRHGRRAGTLLIDSASVQPAGCTVLPVAVGRAELSGRTGDATEFLAMARTQAPQGVVLAPDSLEVEPRMQVVGNILAERILRDRHAQLPNWSRARRQLFPFPVEGSQDLGFTATFLVDDALEVGDDDQGYSLFVLYTPQAQTYDTAYVEFTSYTASGKAAPRVVDFLDWNRDGSVELLLDVYGTRDSWFTAIGKTEGGWQQIMNARCPPSATVTDTSAGLPGEPALDSTAGPATTPDTTAAPGDSGAVSP